MLKKYIVSLFMVFGLFLIFPITAKADGCAMPLLGAEESKNGYAKVTWASEPANIKKNVDDDSLVLGEDDENVDEDEDIDEDEDWDDEDYTDEDEDSDDLEENPNIYAVYRKEGDGKFKLIDFVERKKGEKQQY